MQPHYNFGDMQFTRYYSQFIKANGVPHLNLEQHQRLFNIISLESRLKELKNWSIKFKNSSLERENEYRMFLLRNKIDALTNKKYPKDLLAIMLQKSEIDH